MTSTASPSGAKLPPWATSPERLSRGRSLANAFSEDLLCTRALESLLEEIMTCCAPEPIVLHLDKKYVRTYERLSEPANGEDGVPQRTVNLCIPVSGASDFLLRTDTIAHQVHARGTEQELVFDLLIQDESEVQPDVLSDFLEQFETRLLGDVQKANNLIGENRNELSDAVLPALEARWIRTRTLRGALKVLSIPIQPVTDMQKAIPLSPAPLSLASTESSRAAGAPEWRLADDVAEDLIQTIIAFSKALERVPRTADRLIGMDEEGLRDVLLFILNAGYKGQITAETFIGEGKSDILLRWHDRDAFVGECKIWKGQQGLRDGIDQLLGRYTLWRHSRVALILFIRNAERATSIIDAAHETIRTHDRAQAVMDTEEPSQRRDYTVVGSGDERRPVRLSLIPVVVPRRA